MCEPLSIADVVALDIIVRAASTCAKVARMLEDGTVVYGHARSIGGTSGAFLGPDADVRDAFLRVTTQGGFEAFWPVRDLMPQAATGEFVAPYDWS